MKSDNNYKNENIKSWQIVPTVLDELMSSEDADKVKKVTEAFLKMKKFEIETLVRAFNG